MVRSTTEVSRSSNNVEYSIQAIRWFLKPLGAWPESVPSSLSSRILLILLIIGYYMGVAVELIPSGLSTFLDEDPAVRLRSLGPFVFWIMATIKYYLLLVRCNSIQRCLDHIKQDWKNVECARDETIMLENARAGRYIVGLCMIFMHFGVFSYNLVRGFSSTIAYVGNQSVVLRTVPLPFYNGLIDARFSPVHEVVVATQCLSTFIVNSITVGACSFATMCVMHACGQLCVLVSHLQTFVGRAEKPHYTFQPRLKAIVQQHLRVLSFISCIEDIMNEICLVEIAGCTLNMCLLGHYLITEWEENEPTTSITLSIIFVSISFNIFLFCYIGEVLSEHCKLVGEAAYMVDWHKLPKETAQSFILIISRSSAVIRMTAGKLIYLSLATFGDVLKTSMAYLNMLRTLTA